MTEIVGRRIQCQSLGDCPHVATQKETPPGYLSGVYSIAEVEQEGKRPWKSPHYI